MWYRENRGWVSWENVWADFLLCCGPDGSGWSEKEFQEEVRELAYQETGEERGAEWLEEMTMDHLESLVDQMWSEGEL